MFYNKKKLDQAHKDGWNEGFDVARKKAVHETRKVFMKLLSEELNDSLTKKQPGSYLKGIERSMDIIRKGKR